MKDHEDEIALLERYIGEAGLEERVKEVAELVRRDVENGWEEDVQM
jgi:nuclear pore complex protein Nup133